MCSKLFVAKRLHASQAAPRSSRLRCASAALGLALCSQPQGGRAQAWEASDTVLTETYGPTYKATNTPRDHTNHGADVGIFKTELSHFDTYDLGSNALTLGVQQSNGEDPAERSKRGATQWYGGYIGTLSGNRVFDTQAFAAGPMKDARLDFGFDFNQKNSALENRKREIVFGPSLSLAVPGTLVVGFHVVKEWNHNGIVRKYFAYDPAFQLAIFGSQPLGFTGLPLRLQAIGVIETPKGRDGFGRQTVTSFLSSYDLILDVGALAFSMPRRLDAFVGFQYWLNKTGDDHAIKAGAVEETAAFGLAVHF